MLAAVWDWRPGAVLMLTGLVALLLGHLAVGLQGYRRVMSRPWPRVPPLDDEEE